MRCSARSFAAAARVAVGSMVTTSPPLRGQDGLDGHGSLPAGTPSSRRSMRRQSPRSCSGSASNDPAGGRVPSTAIRESDAASRQRLMRRCIAIVVDCRQAARAPDRTAKTATGRRESRRYGPARRPSGSSPASDSEPSPNSRLRPNQTPRNDQHARIAQHADERQRRHAVRRHRSLAPEAERTAALERKAHRRRHDAGDRRRRADHRRLLAGDASSRCASAPAAAVTAKKARKRSAPNRRATALPNGKQPDRVEAEMRPVGVEQRVGDEGPDLGADAAGQRAAEHVGDRSAPE